MTLLLTRSDIERHLDLPAILTNLEAGFREPPEIDGLRVRSDLPAPGTATALLPGLLPGIPAYTVKVNAKFPSATPALRGLVCLHDLTDGSLLAVLDSATLTAWRTGLAAAFATDVLAAPSASTVGVIGAGAQAAMVLRGLSVLRRIDQVFVHDLDPARAAAFPAEQQKVLAGNAQEVASRADIVVLATWSRKPLLTANDVHAGQHLTTLGADEPGKIELSADLLRSARVVVDDADLSLTMGAIGNVGLERPVIHATLTEVLTGSRPGRESADQVTVYAPVGLPWQDLALAWPVFRAALEAGEGRAIDFLD
jgi:ornithine cyclodeaminase